MTDVLVKVIKNIDFTVAVATVEQAGFAMDVIPGDIHLILLSPTGGLIESKDVPVSNPVGVFQIATAGTYKISAQRLSADGKTTPLGPEISTYFEVLDAIPLPFVPPTQKLAIVSAFTISQVLP
jgi:hypothetical protein